MTYSNEVIIRFYQELNDFLPARKRHRQFAHSVKGNPSVKELIEGLGVPHTEIDLILVNGRSVPFSYQVQAGDRISVYPVFESLDISEIVRLRPAPLRTPRFILDVHLGKLARLLRLLGFDAFYDRFYSDDEIVQIAHREKRILLTRDIGLLKHKILTHGYWLRNTDPKKQIKEVLKRFDLLKKIKPFTRCLECNGKLEPVAKEKVLAQLPPKTKIYYETFLECPLCGRIYWEGSHYEKMQKTVQEILDEN